MIAAVVTDYDDENIVEDCEAGWKRFCSETLVRTHYHVRELCTRHRRLGRYGMQPSTRKEWEALRRQVAAYRWAFDGTGGLFTFDQTCRDLRLDPSLMRRKMLSLCSPRRDINLLVNWVASQRERSCAPCAAEDAGGRDLVSAVRDFHRQHGGKSGRRGVQTHAVCRYRSQH